jgi:hypothetical protein
METFYNTVLPPSYKAIPSAMKKNCPFKRGTTGPENINNLCSNFYSTKNGNDRNFTCVVLMDQESNCFSSYKITIKAGP